MSPKSMAFHIGLAVYVVAGLSAAFLISDEFDHERALFLGYFAVPFAICFLSSVGMYPQGPTRFHRAWRGGVAVLVVAFGWGHVLLLNAIGEGQQKVVVATKVDTRKAMDMTGERGALGHIYRWRM